MSEIIGNFPTKRTWQCPDCNFCTEETDQRSARLKLLVCKETNKRTKCSHPNIRPRKPFLKSP